MKKTEWFEERRDFFLTKVVRHFHEALCCFNLIQQAADEDALDYESFNTWVGTADRKGLLWELKDMCHGLWGDVEPIDKPDRFMFDWIIGTIFHEAMKLKENCYMIHRYAPAIRNIFASDRIAFEQMDRHCREFFNDTMQDIKNGISRISCLFNKAEHSLTAFLKEENKNECLVRYLLKEAEQDGAQCKGMVHKILKDIFPDGMADAYCVAGDSYLEGSWYTASRVAYEKALEIDTECTSAKEGLRILERQLRELALAVERQYIVCAPYQNVG